MWADHDEVRQSSRMSWAALTSETSWPSEPKPAAGADKADFSADAASQGFLLVEVAPPREALRGRLSACVEGAVERELQSRGAPPPLSDAARDADGAVLDLLRRARSCGTNGLAVWWSSLAGIADRDGVLDAGDSTTLRAWLEAASADDERPLRLAFAPENRRLRVYLDPVTIESLLARPRLESLVDSRSDSDAPRSAVDLMDGDAFGMSTGAFDSDEPPASSRFEDEEEATPRSAGVESADSADALALALALTPPSSQDPIAIELAPLSERKLDAVPDRGFSESARAMADDLGSDGDTDWLKEALIELSTPGPGRVAPVKVVPTAAPRSVDDADNAPDTQRRPPLELHDAPASKHLIDAPASKHLIDAPASKHLIDAPAAPYAVDAPATPHTVDAPATPHTVETWLSVPAVAHLDFSVPLHVDAGEEPAEMTSSHGADPVPHLRAVQRPTLDVEPLLPPPLAPHAPRVVTRETRDLAPLAPRLSLEFADSSPPAAEPEELDSDTRRKLEAYGRELDAANGPKPLTVVERLFVNAYVPLRAALDRGVHLPALRETADEWAQSFEKSYVDAFDALRVRTKRPTMVVDVPDVALRVSRLHGARTTQLLLVDGLRYDLGDMVNDRIRALVGQKAACAERFLMWAALPTTTAAQIELIGRGPAALKDFTGDAQEEQMVTHGRKASMIRRVKTGHRELLKLDIVASRLSEPGGAEPEGFPALADEVAQRIAAHFEGQKPRTLVMIFGDHGFSLDHRSERRVQVREGSASPEEVLVPAFAWLVGAVH
jgi:hypothetical protein